MRSKASRTTQASRTSQASPTVQRLSDALAAGAFVLLFVVFVVLRANGGPEWYSAGYLNLFYLTAGGLAFVSVAVREVDDPFWWGSTHLLVGGLAAIFIGRQMDTYVPPEARAFHVAAIFVVYAAYPFTLPGSLRFARDRWPFVGAFATLLGVYCYHLVHEPAGSAQAAAVVFIGLVFAANLFLFPRVVPRDVFLWTLAGTATVVVTLGALAYPLGEYTIASFEVSLYPATFSLPLVGEFHSMQSVFANPNSVGIVGFPGVIAAFALVHRQFVQQRVVSLVVALGLLGVNGFGILLSWSRAAWLASAIGVGLYLSVVVLGRRSVPYVVAACGGLTLLFIVGIYSPVLPVTTNGRGALWSAAFEAALSAPSTLFGHGLENTHELTAQFLEIERHRGKSPHNSYLQLFIRTGVVGLLSFLTLTIGAVVDGARRAEEVDLAALALGSAFVVHYLFESYQIFNIAIGSLISALAFGYLLASGE